MWRGLQATYQLKTDEQKREALQWLKQTFLKQRGIIYSGEMVLYVIIDAFLQRPNDKNFMAAQLDLLRGIGTASIPRPIACYATKLAMTPALAKMDYEEMRRVADQWDSNAINGISRFIREFYGIYIKKSRYFSKLHLFWWKLYIWRYPHLRTLPQKFLYDIANQRDQEENLQKQGHQLSQLLFIENLAEDRVNTFKQALCNNANEEKWKARAKSLGVWDAEKAWQDIEKSVDRCLQLKSNTNDGMYDPELERHFVNLRYVCESIGRRLNTKKLGAGVQNFLDWYKMQQIMEALKRDDAMLNSAFTANHHIIWNWVADLWNQKKHRCLAHYIASVCAPLASTNGHEEMSDILTGIVTGRFR